MSGLRDSLDLIAIVRPHAGTAAIEHEIAAERASSLGAAEEKVKRGLARLAAASDSAELLATVQEAVWAYFVQRELIGFRNHADVIADLGIPAAVLNGLGAAPARRK